ncbi:hypothetical protein [Blastococcus brunescens]|uniref:hypothetical protein n=1 Tax=Blastococcus brunescens TaxID=1564165 RepID=UPI003BEF2108
MFVRRLDDLQTLKERKANRTGKPIEDAIFGPDDADLRWSRFKDFEPGVMHQVIGEGCSRSCAGSVATDPPTPST